MLSESIAVSKNASAFSIDNLMKDSHGRATHQSAQSDHIPQMTGMFTDLYSTMGSDYPTYGYSGSIPRVTSSSTSPISSQSAPAYSSEHRKTLGSLESSEEKSRPTYRSASVGASADSFSSYASSDSPSSSFLDDSASVSPITWNKENSRPMIQTISRSSTPLNGKGFFFLIFSYGLLFNSV